MSDSRTTRAKAKQGAQPIVELKLVRAGAPGLDPREDEEQEQAQEDNVPVLGTDARSPSPPPSSPDTIQADDENVPEEFFQNRPWIDPTVRSHPYPQMGNQALLEYYNQVLQVNPLLSTIKCASRSADIASSNLQEHHKSWKDSLTLS